MMKRAIWLTGFSVVIISIFFRFQIVDENQIDQYVKEIKIIKQGICRDDHVISAVFSLDQRNLNEFSQRCKMDLANILIQNGFEFDDKKVISIKSEFGRHLARKIEINSNRCSVYSFYCFLKMAISFDLFDIYISRGIGNFEFKKSVSAST